MSKEVIYISATKTIMGNEPSQRLTVAAYCRVSSQSDEQYGSLKGRKVIIRTTSMITLVGKMLVFTPKQVQVEALKIARSLKSYLPNVASIKWI